MEFKQGQKLKGAWYNRGEAGYGVGYEGCKAITVVMENGQMGLVPWAYVEFEDKPPKKLNLALMEEVETPPEGE